MVLFRILFGVFYGGLYDFYADDPLCLFRQAEGNGAYAAVGVYDGFSTFEISVFQCFLIVNPASKTSKPKSQPSDIQTGNSTLRQNAFDMFPRSDFCGLRETSALMVKSSKGLVLSHSFTVYFSTRDIKTTVSTCMVWGNMSTGWTSLI